MAFSCPLHSWHSLYDPCPLCITFVTTSGTTSPPDNESETGTPKELLDYVHKSFGDFKNVHGEIDRISCYGGSAFVIFKDGKCYRLQFQAYDQNIVTLD